MKSDAYESTLITFCEALQVELLADKHNLIKQVMAKDDFSLGYIMGLHTTIILLEQEAEKSGLSLTKDLGIDKITSADLVLPK